MKFSAFVVLVALALTAHADEEKEKFKKIAVGCISETDVDKELIGKARTHEYTGRDPKLAAYYACVMTRMQFQQDDGSFNVEPMLEKLPGYVDHETGVKAVKKCAIHDAAVANTDNAMNFVYCFYKNVGKDFKIY